MVLINYNYIENFSDACNYLYKGIPINAPIMNNEDPKYDILINKDLLESLFKYQSFENVPFLNLTIIQNRIHNKEVFFSVLFSLYAVSELFKPYGDYNIALKYKTIALQFLELIQKKNIFRDIQIFETFYILSVIGNYNLHVYYE